jgi:uncharacterized phage-like protein YoqJ
MIIAATGHRPNKLGNDYDMTGPISTYISSEIDKVLEEYEPERCIAGGALGVDTIFALCALYKGIPVTLAIPFKGQESAWPPKSQAIYHKILSHKLVTPYYVCDPGYAGWKMQKRNEWMADQCDLLLAVWDETAGGTANCVKYAINRKMDIIFINPNSYK